MKKQNHIFISYKREDAQAAGGVRQALRAEKLNVWWDEELQTGEQWEERIDEALVNAESVVVLWSSKSIASDWVRHEASIGKLRGILTHAKIETVDIPAPFNSIQAVDLSQWNNREDYIEFQKLVKSIKRIRKKRITDRLKGIIGFFGIAVTCFIFGFLVSRAESLYTSSSKRAEVSEISSPVEQNVGVYTTSMKSTAIHNEIETKLPEPSNEDNKEMEHGNSWLTSTLYGSDNSMATLRSVKIYKEGTSYRIFIENQFKFDCGLKLDKFGIPNLLTNCVSKETYSDIWSVKEKVIRLSCFATKSEDICRGKYTLQKSAKHSSDSEIIIAKQSKDNEIMNTPNKKIQLTVGSAARFQRSFFKSKFSALSEFIVYLPTASDLGVIKLKV